jgi:uncharacterized protein (DUF302 family)
MEGLTTISSSFGPKETMDRLERDVRARGLTVFARIDHAAGAAQVGLPLRPTEVLFFGSAKAGTLLMQMEQTAGIDLPLKVLIWEDQAGKTWLSYNKPAWIAERHSLVNSGPTVHNMAASLSELTRKATEPASTV